MYIVFYFFFILPLLRISENHFYFTTFYFIGDETTRRANSGERECHSFFNSTRTKCYDWVFNNQSTSARHEIAFYLNILIRNTVVSQCPLVNSILLHQCGLRHWLNAHTHSCDHFSIISSVRLVKGRSDFRIENTPFIHWKNLRSYSYSYAYFSRVKRILKAKEFRRSYHYVNASQENVDNAKTTKICGTVLLDRLHKNQRKRVYFIIFFHKY